MSRRDPITLDQARELAYAPPVDPYGWLVKNYGRVMAAGFEVRDHLQSTMPGGPWASRGQLLPGWVVSFQDRGMHDLHTRSRLVLHQDEAEAVMLAVTLESDIVAVAAARGGISNTVSPFGGGRYLWSGQAVEARCCPAPGSRGHMRDGPEDDYLDVLWLVLIERGSGQIVVQPNEPGGTFSTFRVNKITIKGVLRKSNFMPAVLDKSGKIRGPEPGEYAMCHMGIIVNNTSVWG